MSLNYLLVYSSPEGPGYSSGLASGLGPRHSVSGDIDIEIAHLLTVFPGHLTALPHGLLDGNLLAALLRDLLALFAISSVSSMTTGTNLAKSFNCRAFSIVSEVPSKYEENTSLYDVEHFSSYDVS